MAFVPPLADDSERAVAPPDGQGFDAGAGGFGHAQPVEGEQ